MTRQSNWETSSFGKKENDSSFMSHLPWKERGFQKKSIQLILVQILNSVHIALNLGFYFDNTANT